MRKAFTDCSVLREGFTSCLDETIQARRCRMNCFPTDCVRSPTNSPLRVRPSIIEIGKIHTSVVIE